MSEIGSMRREVGGHSRGRGGSIDYRNSMGDNRGVSEAIARVWRCGNGALFFLSPDVSHEWKPGTATPRMLSV